MILPTQLKTLYATIDNIYDRAKLKSPLIKLFSSILEHLKCILEMSALWEFKADTALFSFPRGHSYSVKPTSLVCPLPVFPCLGTPCLERNHELFHQKLSLNFSVNDYFAYHSVVHKQHESGIFESSISEIQLTFKILLAFC